MKGITKKLRGLVFCLAFLGTLVLTGRVEAQAAKLYMTIERFSLGQDFIMEPKVVDFTPGENYASVITRVLDGEHLSYDYSGSVASGFYLQGIKNVDTGVLNIPSDVKYILDELNYGTDFTTADNWRYPGLYELESYTGGAGWMYYINNQYVMGMSDVYPKENDVCRLMFTIALSADLTGQSRNSTTFNIERTFFVAEDKSELVRQMAQQNQKSGWSAGETYAYNEAKKVMASPKASEGAIQDAILTLKNPPSKVPGSDPGTQEDTFSITLDKTSLSLKPGALGSIGYTVSPDSASVTWTSSDTNVASVEGLTNGAIVNAKAKGTTTITATAVSGGQTKTASCTVTVTDDGAASDADFEKGAPKVSVTKKSASSVTISWEAYPGAESYNILRRKSGESFEEIKKGVTGTSYTDSTVKANTTYYYSVEAVKGSQKSKTDTNCMVKTPKAGAEVKAPAKTTLQSVTAKKKQVVLKWKKPARAEGYEVCRATKKNGSYTVVKTIKKAGTLTYTDKKLKSKKTYYYKVRAYRTVDGGKVYGTYSAAKKVKVK